MFVFRPKVIFGREPDARERDKATFTLRTGPGYNNCGIECFANNRLEMMSGNLRVQTQKPFTERKMCVDLEFHSLLLVLNGRADEPYV